MITADAFDPFALSAEDVLRAARGPVDASVLEEMALAYFPEFRRVRAQSDEWGMPIPRGLPGDCDMSAIPGGYDVHAVRQDFPILHERIHGRQLVWLDNGATTQKPRQVIDCISEFYRHENSNVHRGAHTLAARATDVYEDARSKVASFLHAAAPEEIVFTRGTTEAINLAAQAWGGQHVHAGDEILVSVLEHHANIVPWQILCEQTGAVLRAMPVDERGQILLGEYAALLSPRVKLVALTLVSNVLGTVPPAAEMAAMAHRVGAKVLLDAAQGAAHMPVDVRALGCDFLALSGHKLYGPTGIGALWGGADTLREMGVYQGGGNMIEDVTLERTRYREPPHRFEAGTGSIADAVGWGAAIDYVSALGMGNIAAHERDLLEYGTEALLHVPGLSIIGTAAEKAAVLTFTLEGYAPDEIGKALDDEGIAVRAGHHCAQPVLRRFGLEAAVRASLGLYNTREEIGRLAEVLHRLALSS